MTIKEAVLQTAVSCDAKTGKPHAAPLDLIVEEPLAIRIQGRPFMVIMRTPGEEKAHAVGLALAEGVIDTLDDIGDLALCEGTNRNTVTLTLTPKAAARYRLHGERRAYVSQTGCGFCGRELIDDLGAHIPPLADPAALSRETITGCLAGLTQHQPLRRQTRAAHAAALFDAHGALLSIAEDVGRHNALDKAIGRLLLDGRLAQAAFCVLSSRISYELVQKAAKARIALVAAISRPTSLAVDLATHLNMTLVSEGPAGSILIFTHPGRLTGT